VSFFSALTGGSLLPDCKLEDVCGVENDSQKHVETALKKAVNPIKVVL
jgi:hypothetical protein